MESAEQSQSSTSRHGDCREAHVQKVPKRTACGCPSKEMTSPSSLCKVQLRETSRAITNELGTEGGIGEYVVSKKCVKDAGRPSEWAHEVLCAKSR